MFEQLTDSFTFDHADAQLLFSLAEKLSLPDAINEKVGANAEVKNPGMLLTLLAVARASGNLSFPKFQFWYSYSELEEKAGIDKEELTPTNISRVLEKNFMEAEHRIARCGRRRGL